MTTSQKENYLSHCILHDKKEEYKLLESKGDCIRNLKLLEKLSAKI
jgi:hypothetical protein